MSRRKRLTSRRRKLRDRLIRLAARVSLCLCHVALPWSCWVEAPPRFPIPRFPMFRYCFPKLLCTQPLTLPLPASGERGRVPRSGLASVAQFPDLNQAPLHRVHPPPEGEAAPRRRLWARGDPQHRPHRLGGSGVSSVTCSNSAEWIFRASADIATFRFLRTNATMKVPGYRKACLTSGLHFSPRQLTFSVPERPQAICGRPQGMAACAISLGTTLSTPTGASCDAGLTWSLFSIC